MFDFVFVFENVWQWYEENLKKQLIYYLFVGCIGLNVVVLLQDKYGVGMYYNILVFVEERIVKYGMISRYNFFLDLKDWQWMYFFG